MDGSYNLSPEDITAESWQEFVDWDAANPVDMGTEYRGNNGFKRKDHLRQHIRNYHKIESPTSFERCVICWGRTTWKVLNSIDELAQHMFIEHNSSAFICDKVSCDRVGLNGFETKKLFQDHIKKEHPSPFQCTHPGCDRVGSKGWFRERDQKKHMFQKHGVSA
ncbi:hypothetical protein BPAE_0121g00330 [Botrytis paeoniae]|uniref:C2H2-type domain-containing protein n=1 Tax=Botrytis paeoniae TaxID=278948 RepID=A0A4Z1FGR3_9HELO|nr:hypothetical protein BPAE_0121g00330 [Botrytis paeoniae]